MQNIGQDAFIGISFPLPPFDEQQTIARFLDTKTAKIDALVHLTSGSASKGLLAEKQRNLVALLMEYRQALITSAVTGKIDVRGLV